MGLASKPPEMWLHSVCLCSRRLAAAAAPPLMTVTAAAVRALRDLKMRGRPKQRPHPRPKCSLCSQAAAAALTKKAVGLLQPPAVRSCREEPLALGPAALLSKLLLLEASWAKL